MNNLLIALLLAVSVGSPAFAGQELARTKNCLACHGIDNKLIGPAYKDVAKKYANDKGAEAKLVAKVLNGGSGVWGQIPMPPNTHVSKQEAEVLVKWVLSLK